MEDIIDQLYCFLFLIVFYSAMLLICAGICRIPAFKDEQEEEKVNTLEVSQELDKLLNEYFNKPSQELKAKIEAKRKELNELVKM